MQLKEKLLFQPSVKPTNIQVIVENQTIRSLFGLIRTTNSFNNRIFWIEEKIFL